MCLRWQCVYACASVRVYVPALLMCVRVCLRVCDGGHTAVAAADRASVKVLVRAARVRDHKAVPVKRKGECVRMCARAQVCLYG
jgi:hypothetical protein